MKYLAIALAGAALMTTPVLAQTAAAPPAVKITAGAAVSDTSGAPVGTIESVNGTTAVLSTGTAKAAVPTSSFAQGANGLVIGVTRSDLEAQVAKASAPVFAVGAPIVGPHGEPVGTVAEIGENAVTVQTAKTKVQLPKHAFAANPGGGLVIGMTADALEAAAKSATTSG